MKQEILQVYKKQYIDTEIQSSIEQIAKHIEQKMEAFSSWAKLEFHIATSKGRLDSIEDQVTISNPKRFHEAQQKLWSKDYIQKNEGRTRIIKKKHKL